MSTSYSQLFELVLKSRGINLDEADDFLEPDYDDLRHDPFLLPDMYQAIERLEIAHQDQEKITIYGDYDIDGLTATTVLLEAFDSFGFENVGSFIPNRFVEGYGLTKDAIDQIAETGTTLIVTVDCGSLSGEEIYYANTIGVDIIVTDHHNVADVQPPAVGVINPKRLLQRYPEKYDNFVLKNPAKDSGLYPFLDLPGVGVAFKLVQAMQTKFNGMPEGHEKWLLDLVALGTVCDVVTLQDENRMHVYWGLQVMNRSRRHGLRALMAVAGVDDSKVNARDLGFALGPRMNAAGRLETAQYSLDMLLAESGEEALEKAEILNNMNKSRREEQDKIFKEAILQAEQRQNDKVLVLSSKGWNHGIIGIVAAKILEKYHKPTYVLEEMAEESKGSARSFGDFSAADAIRSADDIITKGGGHKLAAGVTLPTANIDKFRQRVNEFYDSLNLQNQEKYFLPKSDVKVDNLSLITEEYIDDLTKLEPFGNGNPEPIIQVGGLYVMGTRRMGSDAQHLKLTLGDKSGNKINVVSFNAPEYFFVTEGEVVNVWLQPNLNEWNGNISVEAKLLHLEAAS